MGPRRAHLSSEIHDFRDLPGRDSGRGCRGRSRVEKTRGVRRISGLCARAFPRTRTRYFHRVSGCPLYTKTPRKTRSVPLREKSGFAGRDPGAIRCTPAREPSGFLNDPARFSHPGRGERRPLRASLFHGSPTSSKIRRPLFLLSDRNMVEWPQTLRPIPAPSGGHRTATPDRPCRPPF